MRILLTATLLAIAQTTAATGLLAQEKEAPVPYEYAQSWPDGRGFEVGDTVPDIPLVDLEGNEVRFSKFLGKRYVLYCWASW